MISRLIYVLAYMLFGTASLVLAQDVVPVVAPVCSGLLCQIMGGFPELNAWLIAIFTFIGIVLRASAELIAFVSLHLKKSDNGWSQKLGALALRCAAIVGWFGGGTPKLVLQAKIDAAVEKSDESK
jgi:hypothetical protein